MQNGGDVQLQMDFDGTSTDFDWNTFLTFDNTKVEDFTAHNFCHTIGDGQFTPIEEIPWDPNGELLQREAAAPAISVRDPFVPRAYGIDHSIGGMHTVIA